MIDQLDSYLWNKADAYETFKKREIKINFLCLYVEDEEGDHELSRHHRLASFYIIFLFYD